MLEYEYSEYMFESLIRKIIFKNTDHEFDRVHYKYKKKTEEPTYLCVLDLFQPQSWCICMFSCRCSVILLLALHLCLFTMIGMLLFAKTEVSSCLCDHTVFEDMP